MPVFQAVCLEYCAFCSGIEGIGVRYFKPLQICGQVISLEHLEPFTFSFYSLRAQRELRVHVTHQPLLHSQERRG